MAGVVIHVLMEMDEEYITWSMKKRKAKAERETSKETE